MNLKAIEMPAVSGTVCRLHDFVKHFKQWKKAHNLMMIFKHGLAQIKHD